MQVIKKQIEKPRLVMITLKSCIPLYSGFSVSVIVVSLGFSMGFFF